MPARWRSTSMNCAVGARVCASLVERPDARGMARSISPTVSEQSDSTEANRSLAGHRRADGSWRLPGWNVRADRAALISRPLNNVHISAMNLVHKSSDKHLNGAFRAAGRLKCIARSDLRAASAADSGTTAARSSTSSKAARRARRPRPAHARCGAHLLCYAGALIVMTAMGLFSTLAFSQMGGEALAVTAVVYARACSGPAGPLPLGDQNLRARPAAPPDRGRGVDGAARRLRHPGCARLAGPVRRPGAYKSFYPLHQGQLDPHGGRGNRHGAIALRFYPFPFIVSIIAFALWFMSMDLAPWIAGAELRRLGNPPPGVDLVRRRDARRRLHHRSRAKAR